MTTTRPDLTRTPAGVRRRAVGAVAAAAVSVALLGGCGGSSDSSETRGCIGEAQGGTVVVQGTGSSLNKVDVGVGSIDVNASDATAMLTLGQGDDPNAVRAVPVTVGTKVNVGGQEYAVAQICRGSVTLEGGA